MKTHKFIRISFVNEWSKKTGDKHITPCLTYCGNKYTKKGTYYHALAIEWWCWAITFGFFSISLSTDSEIMDKKMFDESKKLGYLNVFKRKII